MSTSGLHMHAHTCASLTTYEFIYKKRKNGRKEERKVGRQAGRKAGKLDKTKQVYNPSTRG